jgi:hypothetical protein
MRNALLITICVLLLAVPAVAIKQVYGPVPQYSGTQPASVDKTVPTTGTWFIYNPVSGKATKFGGWGGQTYTFFYPSPVFVNSYLYVDPCFPPYSGMKVTEVCAYNTQPDAPSGTIPTQRGFTAASPEAVIGVGPSFTAGKSGVQHSFTMETCTVGALPSRLAGYDVSKITGPPENIVYIAEATISASDQADFIGQFEYTISYLGQTSSGDPCMPYLHSFQLNISQWDPSVPKISDIDWEAPYIVPGYVTIVTPPTWVNAGGTWGRAGYEANTGSEIVAGTGSFGWTVKGKTPYVAGGHAYLTTDGTLASPVIETMIVGADAGSNCGTAGYLTADLNRDCYVNFQDFAIFAGQWLQCTNPVDTGCSAPTIVGLGIAYNSEDTTGPAVVQGLYDTHVSEIQEGDQIVGFCGMSIANGASLFTASQSLSPLTAGQTIPVTVVRSGSVLNLNITAISISLVDANISYNNKNCTQVTTGGTTSYYTCQCNTGSNVCSCLWLHQPVSNMWHNFIWRGYQVQKVCSDSGGNFCQTPWLGLL